MDLPSSSSAKTKKDHQKSGANNDDNVEIYTKNDIAEIELLESTSNVISAGKDEKIINQEDDERVATIKFHCFSCDMEEMVHYFGLEANFAFGIKFHEATYVMRDPFQPPPPRWKPKAEYFVAIGANCKLCNNVVCKANECSFFYIYTYCLSCVRKVAEAFPQDIQQKLRKQLASI